MFQVEVSDMGRSEKCGFRPVCWIKSCLQREYLKMLDSLKKMCFAFGLLLFTMVTLSACGPDYPKCEKDEHCQKSDQGQSEGRLYCVNGLCQQCRADADCGDGSLECNAGVCEKIPGYCVGTNDCPGNQQCRDNRCGPECLAETDCNDGFMCQGGSCVAKPECSADGDCSDDMVCSSGK